MAKQRSERVRLQMKCDCRKEPYLVDVDRTKDDDTFIVDADFVGVVTREELQHFCSNLQEFLNE